MNKNKIYEKEMEFLREFAPRQSKRGVSASGGRRTRGVSLNETNN